MAARTSLSICALRHQVAGRLNTAVDRAVSAHIWARVNASLVPTIARVQGLPYDALHGSHVILGATAYRR